MNADNHYMARYWFIIWLSGFAFRSGRRAGSSTHGKRFVFRESPSFPLSTVSAKSYI